MKKGEIAWDTIAKLLLALAFLLILSIALYLMRDKMALILERITRILRFGA